ncbi:MAG: aldehyde dehydrogenase family protein [Acetobacteraceae bacterium]
MSASNRPIPSAARAGCLVGGYKRSGIGRESGHDMMHEYLQTKSVWIDTGSEVPNPFVLR